MPYLKAFPHTLRPVPLSREAGAGVEEGMPGTIPIINQQHIPQHHISGSHHTQLMHVRDTMEILLHIEGKVVIHTRSLKMPTCKVAHLHLINVFFFPGLAVPVAENTAVVEAVHCLSVEVVHPAVLWSTQMVAVIAMDSEEHVEA